ncbi:carbohydrate sulfotransferase 8 [Stigmatopora nigra]
MPGMKWKIMLGLPWGRLRLRSLYWFLLVLTTTIVVLLIHRFDKSDVANDKKQETKPGETMQQPREAPTTIQDRRHLIKTMCGKYKSNMSKTITRHHVNHIYVEDKYKILYCQVPKVACSNWKRILLVLSGHASDIEKITHKATYKDLPLKTLNTFDQAGIMERLANYTKFMFVRDPLERLVSAYRDKLENHNAYYHTLFGRFIISKYRPNASKLALEYGDGVTFLEFVQYLLDMPSSVSKDIHWEAANRLCNPCHIDYDFVGKFENMSEESDSLLRLAGAPPDLKLPNLKDRNPSDEKTSLSVTQKYMSQLDSVKRQQLYDLYKLDFLMFNYSKPFPDLY